MREKVEKANPVTPLVEMSTGAAITENSMGFLKKLKTELLYDSAIPLLGMYLNKTIIQKDTCILVFIAALVTIAKKRKPAKCP